MKKLIVVLLAAGLVISSTNVVNAQKKGELKDPDSFISTLMTRPLERKIKVKIKGVEKEYNVYLVHLVNDPETTIFVLDDGKLDTSEVNSACEDPTEVLVIESVKVSAAMHKIYVKELVKDGTLPPEFIATHNISLSFGSLSVVSNGETGLVTEAEVKSLNDVLPGKPDKSVGSVGPRKK